MSNHTSLRTRALSAAAVLLLAGCSAIGPTGTNVAPNPLPTPNADGDIVISFPVEEGVTSATFSIRNKPADSELEDLVDDSPEGADEDSPCADAPEDSFCVSFKADELPANVYLMDVYYDDDDTAAGTISFIAGGAAPAGDEGEEDEDASGEEDTETEEEGDASEDEDAQADDEQDG